MVALENFSCQKKSEREDTSRHYITQRANVLYFAISSLRILVDFLNDEIDFLNDEREN